ncbi:hypothetical protein NCS52_00981600 [Fusarium sp. LHS14.1]|nr:hypothetical protein NCS52_00981600 [Fusarium sp. LHS14.1]
MRSLMFTALSILGLVASVCSETQFTNPATWDAEDDDRSNYRVYEVGDRIPIRWTTDRDRISVAVWESGGSGPFLWAWVDQNLTERSTTWRVDFGNGRFDTDIGAEHASGSMSLVDSASFNVTVPNYKPASATAKTTTTKDTATSSTPIETESESDATSISTTATSSPTESVGADVADKEEDKETGLSAVAAAGIGVDASVGGISILGAIGFLIWRHLKRRKEQQNSGSPQFYTPQYHPQTQYQPGLAQLQSPEAKAELPTHSTTTSMSQVYEAP